jgi:hypothetical protein
MPTWTAASTRGPGVVAAVSIIKAAARIVLRMPVSFGRPSLTHRNSPEVCQALSNRSSSRWRGAVIGTI